MNRNDQNNSDTLRLIAGFKLFEALLLIVAGCGALGMIEPTWQHSIVGWLDDLSLREGRRLTSELAGKASDALGTMSMQRFVLIAIGCFVYAAVFLVEATGLWLRKRWAEYLTTIVTASLLPFEIMELVHKVSTARALTLFINVVVLLYLVWHLVSKRKQEGASTP